MSFVDIDLTVPLRNALIAEAAVTAFLEAYNGSFPVFSNRPVPDDAPLPLILISQDISNTEQDWVNDFQPMVIRDVSSFGRNDMPGQVRDIVALAYTIKNLFHRNRRAIVVPGGWTVTEIVTSGPVRTAVEDQRVGMSVELAIRLAISRE